MNKLKSIDHIDNNNVTTTVKPPKFTAILNGMNSEHHGQIICNPETLKTLNSVINSAGNFLVIRLFIINISNLMCFTLQ